MAFDNLVEKIRTYDGFRPILEPMVREHGPLVTTYLEMSEETELLRISETDENGELEPMYFFNDDLGGYTIGGIERSVKDSR